MMLADADLQKAFHLLLILHPDRDVAACILVEACETVEKLQRVQEKRVDMRDRRSQARADVAGAKGPHRQRGQPNSQTPTSRPYTLALPESCVLQAAVYQTSNRWERDQESQHPQWRPSYRPTPADQLIRYLKALIGQTMQRRPAYAAVALGCSLYTYVPREISGLVPWVTENIDRYHWWVRGQIMERFPSLVRQGATLPLRRPTSREQAFVTEALGVLTPWTAHLTLPPGAGVWETHFGEGDAPEDLELLRVHALMDPNCAGLACMIREYNAYWGNNDMPLEDPDNKLGIPFPLPVPPPPESRLQPDPMSANELSRVRHCLARHRAQRQHLRAERFSVYVDGTERTRFGADTGFHGACLVSTDATYVEVFGHDADGPLLLAVFPLPEMPWEEEIAERHWIMEDEGGQTIDLVLQPVQAATGVVTTYRLECWSTPAPQAATHRTAVRDALVRWVSALWQPLWAGEPVTAADIPAQEQVFTLDEGEIRLTCAWRAAYQHQPATLRVAWQADLPAPTDMWIRFTRPDDPTRLLAEVQLGQALAGEIIWTEQELTFDPTREPWALTIVLKAPET